MSKLQQRIAKGRKRSGMTQAVLAERMGVTRGACSQWENGRSVPNTTNLRKLARILDLNLPWLMSGTGVMGASGEGFGGLKGKKSATAERFKAAENRSTYSPFGDSETKELASLFATLGKKHRKLLIEMARALSPARPPR